MLHCYATEYIFISSAYTFIIIHYSLQYYITYDENGK